MLKDLKLPSKADKLVADKEQVDADYDIAVDIINDIFDNMSLCLKKDRSRVKINMLAKGYIGYILKDAAREGITNFVRGMYPEDMKLLLNDIERDIARRKRQ